MQKFLSATRKGGAFNLNPNIGEHENLCTDRAYR